MLEGGRLYSLQLALHDDRITACVICYGRAIGEADKLKPLKARGLGIFGEDDKGIPADGIRAFESALKEAGKKAFTSSRAPVTASERNRLPSWQNS